MKQYDNHGNFLLLISNSFLLGEGNGTPLQYSCLENPMDGGAWQAAVHGVAKSRARLSDFTFTFHFHELEKEMATYSSVLAWRIPGNRGAWWAAVYDIAQSDRTEATQQQQQQSFAYNAQMDGEHFPSFQQRSIASTYLCLQKKKGPCSW